MFLKIMPAVDLDFFLAPVQVPNSKACHHQVSVGFGRKRPFPVIPAMARIEAASSLGPMVDNVHD